MEHDEVRVFTPSETPGVRSCLPTVLTGEYLRLKTGE